MSAASLLELNWIQVWWLSVGRNYLQTADERSLMSSYCAQRLDESFHIHLNVQDW